MLHELGWLIFAAGFLGVVVFIFMVGHNRGWLSKTGKASADDSLIADLQSYRQHWKNESNDSGLRLITYWRWHSVMWRNRHRRPVMKSEVHEVTNIPDI